ncbi:hypothetical protein MTO96_040681, partial [Rhipicephalus appendiculatus]
LSPASDSERQRLCPVPAASPARPPSLLRMLRPGPHTLNFSPRDSICINHRDIIAAFSGFGSTVAMTPTGRTPLFFAQLLVMACCPCGAVMNASATVTATRAYRFSDAMARTAVVFPGGLVCASCRRYHESSSMGPSIYPTSV